MGFKQTRNGTIAISGPLLLAKAFLLAKDLGHNDFVATTGYQPDQTFDQFCMKKISGKEKSVSKDVEAWLYSTLPDLLKTYKPEDIYNADKTGLFYKLQLNRILVFKGEKCSGEKGPLLVTGISKSPIARCFAGEESPLTYVGNSKAWMTNDI